jgi:hypothetical protein
MNVKKTIKKLVALGTGATMVGATLMGAMASDLSEYPSPFVKDGVVDSMIVIGANAKPMDTLGAIDIAASLQAAATTPVAVGGSVGQTQIVGDNVQISRSSNLLEVNQYLGDVRKTLTESDLKALTGGTLNTAGHSTKYNQYIRLNFTDPDGRGANSGQVVFAKDTKTKITGDFLYFASGQWMFEYQLEFSDGLQSDVETDGTLSDLEDESINIFGQDYSIVGATRTAPNDLQLTLMGGDVTDTLGEGETKTYTIDGVDYEITAVFISDNTPASTKFLVNGEATKELNDGETDILSNNVEIGVRSIMTNQREGIVEFFLGANKLILQDDNYNNDAFYAGVEVGGESITDARVKIKAANITGTKYAINSIYYQVKANRVSGSKIYVPPGHGIREYMEKPESMLNPTWDIKYEGLTDVKTFPIKMDPQGDDAYYLEFTNNEGLEYNIPFVDNSGSTFKIGSDAESLWFTEDNVTNRTNFHIAEDDYFIVNDRNDDQGITHVLQYTSLDTGNKKIILDDLASGSKEVSYTGDTDTNFMSDGGTACSGANGNLVVGGATYQIYVCGNETYGYNLSVDHNGDGTFTYNKVTNISVKGGGVLTINASTTERFAATLNGDVNVTLVTPKRLFDENGPYSTTGVLQASTDETDMFTILKRSGNQVGISVGSGQTYLSLEDDQTNNDYKYALSPYGAFWTYYNPTGDTEAETLTIDYPEQERGAQVFVTAGAVKTSKTGASGDAYIVNKASVGIAVLDKDVELGKGNLIVVGGPCVNTIAQELMGNPENCAGGFEPGKAVIKLYGDKNALLVAGYDWQDTLGAAYVLSDYADYELAGTEMEVTVADLDTITVKRIE